MLTTALDLCKLESGLAYPLIEENKTISPEFSLIPADKIDGDSMTLTVRTDIPSLGFRNYNEGASKSVSKFETRTFQTHLIDHRVEVDMALLDGKKEAAAGKYLVSHASGAVEASIRLMGDQFYYGGMTDSDKGFPGLIRQANNATSHTVSAAGTGDSRTSVWFLKLGRESLEFLFGNGRTLGMRDWVKETLYDDEGKPFQGLCNWFNGRVGMRLANRNHAVRIKNITTAKPLTDPLMFEALRKFTELGSEPTVILANATALEMLRAGRTATNTDGKPAPLPRDFEGIPIIRTSRISNAENAELSA